MAYVPRPKPTFGHPVRRTGKPYIYATWLAKLLGGDECRWSAWFKARYQHAKFEQQGEQLAEWNRDHTELMKRVRTELEENGWTCTVEGQNDFRLEFPAAVVAGKPDLIATMPGHALIVDGKTGRRRDSDVWQVILYLRALQLTKPALVEGRHVEAEVRYKHGAPRVFRLQDITPDHRQQLVDLVKVVAGPEEPARTPSQYECGRCTIGFADCPQRFREDEDGQAQTAHAGAF